jgi:hypothetical protein
MRLSPPRDAVACLPAMDAIGRMRLGVGTPTIANCGLVVTPHHSRQGTDRVQNLSATTLICVNILSCVLRLA